MGAAENRIRPRGNFGGAQKAATAAVLALAAALLVQLSLAVSASAAEPGGNHVFDALRSLNGSGTAVSSVDPIPDPGPNHPPATFFATCGLAADEDGNIYVSSYGSEDDDGRIDIFDADGEFLTEIANPDSPCDIAVDSVGNIYVRVLRNGERILRYEPSEYPPTSAVEYEGPFLVDGEPPMAGLAVNRANDHLFVVHPTFIKEYGSAAEDPPNQLLDGDLAKGTIREAHGIAVDSTSGNIFVGSVTDGAFPIPSPSEPFVSVVYVLDPSGARIATIDGSDTPAGGFSSAFGTLFPAIDEETGELFISDGTGAKLVYRFLRTGPVDYEYLEDPELEDHSYSSNDALRLAVVNNPAATNANYVYVTSPSQPISRVFAFAPEPEIGAPLVSETDFSDLTETEVTFTGVINPHGFPTRYEFQYVDQKTFEAEGFANPASVPASAQPIGGGSLPIEVSQSVSGLDPGTAYRFRLVAENCVEGHLTECVTEGEIDGISGEEVPHVFSTFPPSPSQGACPNEEQRVGPSADLPDCRAYELVTPADPGPHAIFNSSLGAFAGGFPTHAARADGEAINFQSLGGPLPGPEGNGFNDRYVARRSSSGWGIKFESPTGSQMQIPSPGGMSSDFGFSFWRTGAGKGTPDSGSLVIGNKETEYLRRSDGTFELLGDGELGIDPDAKGRWIAANGSHAIFTSTVRLEGEAPPSGIEGVYDRTSDGDLHVVSLLPGDVPVPAGAVVQYEGSSADGSVVAFKVTQSGVTSLYLRVDNAETILVQTGATVYGGLSADGGRLTYVLGGNVFSYDVGTQTAVPVGSGGASTLVNVSADGSHVYFVSTKVLGSGSGPKSNEQNLYVWDVDTNIVRFIAVLTKLDVVGEPVLVSATNVHALGLWTATVSPLATASAGPGNDPSRTSSDGRFFVFESHAPLTGYDSGGAAEVFRYDAQTEELTCVSCNPALAAEGLGAQLQSLIAEGEGVAPLNSFILVENLLSTGKMVFFESEERLVAKDANAVRDVYEWEQAGVGGCARPEGCISLISAGRGSQPSYLYGVGGGGRDVFFVTSDSLVPGAQRGTPAVYDARIGGGFRVAEESPACQLDGCQAGVAGAPQATTPSSSAVTGPGNVKPSGKRCKKNQRKVKRQGKVRCVKKHRKQGRKSRSGAGGQEGSK